MLPADGTVLQEGMAVVTSPDPGLTEGMEAVSYTHLVLAELGNGAGIIGAACLNEQMIKN